MFVKPVLELSICFCAYKISAIEWSQINTTNTNKNTIKINKYKYNKNAQHDYEYPAISV